MIEPTPIRLVGRMTSLCARAKNPAKSRTKAPPMIGQYRDSISLLIGTPELDDEFVGGGSWPRSVFMEMDDKFTSAVREAFAAGNESATAAAATVVTTTSRRR
jgi:hypothetical protein